MARYQFGGGIGEFTFGLSGTAITMTGGVNITMWGAETGSARYTDLRTMAGLPLAAVTSSNGSDGRSIGTIPAFFGPDGVVEMWASADGGPRVRLLAVNPQAGSGGSHLLGDLTGAVNVNPSNGRVQTATLIGDVNTVSIAAGSSIGDELTLILRQDAAGERAWLWPASVWVQNGDLSVATAPNSISIASFLWDGFRWVEKTRTTNNIPAGSGSGSGTGGPSGTGLTLRVVNNTGEPNSAIKMYIVGTNLVTAEQGYSVVSGQFTAADMGDLSGGFVDIGVPMTTSGDTYYLLPRMTGQIYFSVDDTLLFSMVPGGSGPTMVHPVGHDVADPNYAFVWDRVEFDYTLAGMYARRSNVDMFGLDIGMSLYGVHTQHTGAMVAGGRSDLFAEMATLPDFDDLIIGTDRIIAPKHGITTGDFSATYFDSYVNLVWANLTSGQVQVETPHGLFLGTVVGSTLNFSGGVRAFAKPTTAEILSATGSLADTPDPLSNPVAAVLVAGWNRAVLHNDITQPTNTPNSFYGHSIGNHYARLLHEYAADGKAIGFVHDDVAGQAAILQDSDPTALTITLGPI